MDVREYGVVVEGIVGDGEGGRESGERVLIVGVGGVGEEEDEVEEGEVVLKCG